MKSVAPGGPETRSVLVAIAKTRQPLAMLRTVVSCPALCRMCSSPAASSTNIVVTLRLSYQVMLPCNNVESGMAEQKARHTHAPTR